MSYLTNFPIPLLGFAAFSGTGKTTLLEKLIPTLVEKGMRIALIKHSHHNIEMDKPGKDSYRLRKAGASQVVLSGTHRSIFFCEYKERGESKLCDQLALLQTDKLDLVLVEGYRDELFPKIELHRSKLNKPFLFPNDNNIIALVCDKTMLECKLPQFQFEDLDALSFFIKSLIHFK
jgi:molybdopterin-guanine dinucleotide biosynthesis protein MobB